MLGLLLLLGLAAGARAASFQVAQDAFLLNGQPIQIRSGSIHYHRTHPSTWADRLRRLHAMGLNTVQTYVPWNWHSQAPGSYDFTGGRDLVAFIRAVQAEGLLLNLRAGPYICGESDFGGLPSYLLNTPGIASAADLRTNNTAYMAAVSEWWGVLLPLVAPLLIANGGPIAMTQLENEFGSYGSVKNNPADRAYMMALRALALQLLPAGSQLYTTDGNDAGYLNGGAVPGVVFATGDGSGPPWAADAVRCALCRSVAPPPPAGALLCTPHIPHTQPLLAVQPTWLARAH
jgi:beta-galactosidase